MDSTIHKYTLSIADDQDVAMPCGPGGIQILHVGLQGGSIQLWARVQFEYPKRYVRVHVRGTGHPMGEIDNKIAKKASYVGTVMTSDEMLVLHVFAQTDHFVRVRNA